MKLSDFYDEEIIVGYFYGGTQRNVGDNPTQGVQRTC